jgi:uncharacterized protein YjdB
MIFSKKKKILSAVLSLAMIGSMVAAVPFTASADTTTAATPGVSYSVQGQTYGWQAAVTDGTLAGTVGKSKRLEATKINLTNAPAGASITYQVQGQTYGWQSAKSDGALAGTVGQAKRLEAIKITLSGMPGYEVQYKVQGQTYGWQDWVTTTNGTAIADAALAGTVGQAKRLEAIEIRIVPVTAPVSTLAVSSVAATSATTMAVTFNGAPADTSKVAFTVKGSSGTASTVTTTWNSTDTVATLTNATNFAPDTYSVDVQNSGTDLGSTNVTMTAQEIGKIAITSSKLAVSSNEGYATYKVLDQYGNDITSSGLADDVTFQCGVGTISASNGEITLQPTGWGTSNVLSLITFPTVVITGYDSTSGTSTSATLTTSTQVGTLSTFQLGTALTNANGKTLSADDTSDLFYLPFTATDVSGNSTSNYNLITNGLILNQLNGVGSKTYLTTSNSAVVAQIVQDPNNSNDAVIQVTATSATIPMNEPVVITAMTWTGSTSSFTVTLNEQSTLSTFTLQAPASEVATGESTVIPCVAEDQYGNAITSFSGLYSNGTLQVTLSNAIIQENADGTFEVIAGPAGAGFSQTGNQVVTATTLAGKYSSLTINVQNIANPNQLVLSQTELKGYMETGSSQGIDFGYDNGGLSALDQYDRAYDMTGSADSYEAIATSSAPAIISTNVVGTGIAAGASIITLTAGNAGTATITFNLVNTADGHVGTLNDPHTVISSQSETITVLATNSTSITGYTLSAVPNAIYAYQAAGSVTSGSVASGEALPTGMAADYSANPTVYGTTSNSSDVVLAGNPIVGESLSDPTDFAVNYDGAAGDTHVTAFVPANSVTTASTTLTASVLGADGYIHTVTTPIKSSTAAPDASSVAFYADTTTAGISVSNNIVTLPAGDLTGQIVYTVGNNDDGSSTPFYFYANDQYGQKDATLNVYVGPSTLETSASVAIPTSAISFDSKTGELSFGGAVPASGTVVLTAVAANGKSTSTTIKIG